MRNCVPASWETARADSVCEKIQDGTHFSPKIQLSEGQYPYVTAKNVRPTGLDLGNLTYLNPEDHAEIYRRADVRQGDVLLVKDGVNAGDAAINTLPGEISLLSSVCFLRPHSEILKAGFLRYFLQSPLGNTALTGKLSGTAIRRIILRRVRELEIPIAPLNEQRQIVEAIESYLTRLDDAVASLERVQRNLNRYRASVLKAAVEGRLVPTEAELAKEEGRSYEPASVLLERILAERKDRWIEDAAEKSRAKAETKARKAGKPWTPEDDAKALVKARAKARLRYKEPEAPDTTDLPTLPEGWRYLSVDQFNTGEPNAVRRGPFGSTLRKEFFVPSGIKVYEQQHAINRDFSLGRYYVTQEKFESLRSFETKPGDIIMSCSGTIGKTAIVPASAEPGIINQALLKLSLDQRIILNRYFEIVFAALLRRAVAEEARGTGMQNLAGIKELKQLAFPVPPTPEQDRILLEFERLDSAIHSWASAIEAAIKRSQRLRQSILNWAFEGKLVEQDPDDEPASELLERIRSEAAGVKR